MTSRGSGSGSDSDECGANPFRNLCMRRTDTCDVCHRATAAHAEEKTERRRRVVHFGRLQAIALCSRPECQVRAKRRIVSYLNERKVVPLFPLYRERLAEVRFYRASQRGVCSIGRLAVDNDRFFRGGLKWSSTKRAFGLPVAFGDQHRYVSLENVLHHNEGLYARLVGCESLLDDAHIRIALSDLSSDIRGEIRRALERSRRRAVAYGW